MEIEKILTPSGIKALKYFTDKTEYHFATITKVTDNSDKCYISMRKALFTLAEAGILNKCPTSKMILFMRNPNSNFLTLFRTLTETIERNND
jgi:hypothetical protein